MQSAVSSIVFKKVALAVERAVCVKASTLSPSTRLQDDLAIDRFGRLRLGFGLAKAFNIQIESDALDRCDTLGDVVDYLSCRFFRDIEPPVRELAR